MCDVRVWGMLVSWHSPGISWVSGGMLISPAPSWAGRVACLVEILLVSLGLIGSFRSCSPPSPIFIYLFWGGASSAEEQLNSKRFVCVQIW